MGHILFWVHTGDKTNFAIFVIMKELRDRKKAISEDLKRVSAVRKA